MGSPLPNFNLKDSVEIIESRLPGGKWLTRVLLLLVVLTLIVFLGTYLWVHALVPIAHIATALVTGTSFNVKVTFGDVVTLLLLAIFLVLSRRVINRLMKLLHSNLNQTGQLIKIVDDYVTRVNKANESISSVVKLLEKTTDAMGILTERVIELERIAGIGPKLGTE